MKKIHFLILILIIFTSCNYNIETVNDPDSITTVEMAREIEKDTTEYKVLKKDSTIYLINKHTNKIEKRINTAIKEKVIGVGIIVFVACFIIGICIKVGGQI